MKKIVYTLFVLAIVLSCSEDDSVSCTTCNSSQTTPFEVCKDSNGNASVNGEDTGTNYNIYIEGLEAAGATCGN